MAAKNFIDGIITPSINGGQISGFRNKVINGDMRIDQRYNGVAAKTLSSNVEYTLDRWNHTYVNITGGRTITIQRLATTPPAGFINYIRATHTSTGTAAAANEIVTIQQIIEGYLVDDLDWSKSTAKNATISFWVRSSVTGTMGGAVGNGTGTGRAWPFTYTINAANTWEYKTVTITGDTAGVANTWVTDNRASISLKWALCVGTTYQGTANSWNGTDLYSATGTVNMASTTGATFDITGVQFEIGSQASTFERRPYGVELNLCKRYFNIPDFDLITAGSNFHIYAIGQVVSATNAQIMFPLPVQMRSAPTISTGTIGNLSIATSVSNIALTALTLQYDGKETLFLAAAIAGGMTTNAATSLTRNNVVNTGNNFGAPASNGFIAFNAEL